MPTTTQTVRSLDAAKTKIQWAEKHFGDFKDIVFGRSTGVDTRKTTVVHYNLQGQSHAGSAHFAPSREARLAFGDAVHQLRSSLDHVVYTLVDGLTTDPKVLRKIDFPIYVREDLLGASKGVKHLKTLLPADQFAEILAMQPYQRNRTAPETDWLWVLNELDNIDKHRTILVVDPRLMVKRREADGTVSVVKHRITPPFIPGIQGFSVSLPAPTSHSEVNVEERALVVVLAETGLRCDNITAIKVWRELVGSVKAVIDRFERFC